MGVKERMGEWEPKVQAFVYTINKSRGYNVQHGNHS